MFNIHQVKKSRLQKSVKNNSFWGNSLVVQWLRLGAFTAVALSSVPGWGTKIPQATWYSQKKKKFTFVKNKTMYVYFSYTEQRLKTIKRDYFLNYEIRSDFYFSSLYFSIASKIFTKNMCFLYKYIFNAIHPIILFQFYMDGIKRGILVESHL